MKVTLIAHTPEPEKIIAAAAKLCYSASNLDDLLTNLDEAKAASFVAMLAQMGHESPIEHVSFTFGIEGVSRALLAQLTRHRIASFSVQSQRYVKEKNFSYVIPPEIEADEQAKEVFTVAMEYDLQAYNTLADLLEKRHMTDYLAKGYDESKAKSMAQKKAIEDARFVLPNACETKLIATFNARSLYHFFNIRCCNRAQWEIKALADEMLRLCVATAPTLFVNAGPSCMQGACPEGKMSCGDIENVRKRYKELRAK